MRNAQHHICLGLFLLLCAGVHTLCAQGSVVLERNPPPAMPAREVIKTVGTAKADYQPTNDHTYSNSRAIRVELPNGGWGMISAGFSSKGKVVTRPESVTLRIFTASKTRQYVDDPRLLVRSDVESLFEGAAEIAGARTNGKDIYTSFEIKLPRLEFEKLADAKVVEITQSGTKWTLSGSEIDTFKDLTLLYK